MRFVLLVLWNVIVPAGSDSESKVDRKAGKLTAYEYLLFLSSSSLRVNRPKSSRRDQNLVPHPITKFQTCPFKLLLSLHVNCSRDFSQGLVPSYVPITGNQT